MEKLKLRLVGVSPLMLHDNKSVNPLGIWAKTMKPLTSKRNKTDADYEEIARMEWEAGLYLENGVVAIPARCLEKTMHNGAKKTKCGVKYTSGVFIQEDSFELKYKGQRIKVNGNGIFPNPELDKYYPLHIDQRIVRVSGNGVLRTRPIFHDWSLECTLLYDENVIDSRTLIACAEDAGRLVGMCEMRPRLGRFNVEVMN